MKKGISPVIAIVLLLMMTVAAAGAAYFWLTSMQSSIQKSAGSQIGEITEQAGASFNIPFANCSNSTAGTTAFVRIRNTGSVDFEKETGVLLTIEYGGSTQTQGNYTLGDSIGPNELSEPLRFKTGTLDNYNKDHSLTVSLGSISRSTVVNCSLE